MTPNTPIEKGKANNINKKVKEHIRTDRTTSTQHIFLCAGTYNLNHLILVKQTIKKCRKNHGMFALTIKSKRKPSKTNTGTPKHPKTANKQMLHTRTATHKQLKQLSYLRKLGNISTFVATNQRGLT